MLSKAQQTLKKQWPHNGPETSSPTSPRLCWYPNRKMGILRDPAMSYQLSAQVHLKRPKDSDQSPMWLRCGKEEHRTNPKWPSLHPTPAEKVAAGERVKQQTRHHCPPDKQGFLHPCPHPAHTHSPCVHHPPHAMHKQTLSPSSGHSVERLPTPEKIGF